MLFQGGRVGPRGHSNLNTRPRCHHVCVERGGPRTPTGDVNTWLPLCLVPHYLNLLTQRQAETKAAASEPITVAKSSQLFDWKLRAKHWDGPDRQTERKRACQVSEGANAASSVV